MIGNGFAVQLARMQPFQVSSKYAVQIRLDVERTFNGHPASEYKEAVEFILNQFASLHSMGYAQGMNFLAMGLHWVYVQDSPTHAKRDTVYSMPRLIKICLPLYPVDKNDRGPLRFCRSVARLIGGFFPDWNEDLQTFCEIYILHFWPPLFANLFPVEKTIFIWKFLIHPKSDRDRYTRLFLFTLELISTHRRAFPLGGDRFFKILSTPHVHDVHKLVETTREKEINCSPF